MIQAELIGPGYVAAVRGLDLKRQLLPDEIAQLKRLAAEHGVLLFPGQHLSQPEQAAFARSFGELDVELQKTLHKLAEPRIRNVELLDVSNLAADGSVAGREHGQTLLTLGNMLWHSDGTMREYANHYTMLFAHVVPSWGGNTEFADLRAAHDALDDRTKALIADKVAGHALTWSRDLIGLLGTGYSHRQASFAWRPLVDVHPESGRSVLRANIYASEIAGMPLGEARLLLLELLEHATQPRFVYSHAWTPGDVVLFDNRSVAHRVRRFDLAEPRELTRAATMEVTPALQMSESYSAAA